MDRHFQLIWDQLRAKKAQYRTYLDAVRVQNLRGISDLQIALPYPVSVIAGTQGCGKSTVLMAAASAYNTREAKLRDFVPSTFFPSFTYSEDSNIPSDRIQGIKITYNYIENSSRTSMTWSKGKSWNRSFAGRKNAKQPLRQVYVRTLSTLANPSEVRSALQMGRLDLTSADIDPALISFAQRVLPFRYSRIDHIRSDRRDLLFAHRKPEEEVFFADTLVPESQKAQAQYSEFHMSGGERAILRLSMDISNLREALVLIDEVEIALHPYTQHALMMELQRLALRNELQIIVTSHSPAIFDCVPPEARIFLERTSSNVIQKVAYPDVLQNAFYGRNNSKLSVLCEDAIIESIVRGVFDYLSPKLNLRQSDVVIGRDSGKYEFPAHMKTIRMFHELENFIFVLDGDAEDDKSLKGKTEQYSSQIVYLPGDSEPERWLLDTVELDAATYADVFSVTEAALRSEVSRIRRLYDSATVRQADKYKYMFEDLCQLGVETPSAVARKIAKKESELARGLIVNTRDKLEDAVTNWRAGSSIK